MPLSDEGIENTVECIFCKDPDAVLVEEKKREHDNDGHIKYQCKKCGLVYLNASKNIPGRYIDYIDKIFTPEDKKFICMGLRNRYEENRIDSYEMNKLLSIENLKNLCMKIRAISNFEKINYSLLILYNKNSAIGMPISLLIDYDYFLFFCRTEIEMIHFLILLSRSGLVELNESNLESFLNLKSKVLFDDNNEGISINLKITYNGYKQIEELVTKGKGNQCFIAMWFNSDMDDAYEAMKRAIEYVEEDQDKPKYRAFRIDNKDHNNNINDEIIAEIRRSKFMVCDLTGYRGGVYFEAGFAYGLGLEVIYTCRKDWTKELVTTYYDEDKKPVQVRREGVHFDLAHTNRIEWEPDNLDKFEEALKHRIRRTVM